MARGAGWTEGLGAGAAIVLLVFSATGCAGMLSGRVVPADADACFGGTFSRDGVSLQVLHDEGLTSATGWHRAGSPQPWEFLDFSGRVVGRGEARGRMTLLFPPTGSPDVFMVPTTTVPEVTLSLPVGGATCAGRTPLQFRIRYEFEGRTHDEAHVLDRLP